MKKDILKEYIKAKVRVLLTEKEAPVPAISDVKKDLYLINRLPPLKRALITLMTKAYDQYITGVKLEAPRPTTFKVSLINGLEFYLIYSGGRDNAKFDLVNGNFYAQIAGKRYDLASVSEAQQAMKKLSQQLILTPAAPDEIKPVKDAGEDAYKSSGGGGGGFSGGDFGNPGDEDAEEEGGPEPEVVGQAAPPASLDIPQPEINKPDEEKKV